MGDAQRSLGQRDGRRRPRAAAHRDLVDDDDVGRGEPHEAVRSLAALEPRVLERAVRVQQACRVDRVAADEPRRLGARGEHDDPQPLAAPVHDEEAGDGRLAHAALAREEGVELLLAGLLEQRVGLVLRLLEHVWARRAGLVPRDDRHRCPLVALARRLLEPRCRSGRLLIARVADLVAQACRVDARLPLPVAGLAVAASVAAAVSYAGSRAVVCRPAQHVGSHGVEHRLHGVEHVLLGEHRLHALGREAAAGRVSRDGLAQPVLSRGDHSAQFALPSQRAERVGGVRLDERLGRAVAPWPLEKETLVEVERAVLRREHPVVPHRPHARSGHHPLAVLVRPARLRIVDGHRVPVLAGQRDAAHPDVAALALLRRHVAPLLDLEGAVELGVEHGVEVMAVDDALGPVRVEGVGVLRVEVEPCHRAPARAGRPRAEVRDGAAVLHLVAEETEDDLGRAHDARVEEVHLRREDAVAQAQRVAVADDVVRLGLADVLGNIREEASRRAVLHVHGGARREEPQGHIRRQPLVLGLLRAVLVAVCLGAELVIGVADWARVKVLAVLDLLAVLHLALWIEAVMPLHVQHEVSPRALRGRQPRRWVRRIAAARRGAADGLRVAVPFDPDGHVHVQRRARLVLLPIG
eukprot:scaffold66122_cov69-Phaeocystis_antarctica.AAC.1